MKNYYDTVNVYKLNSYFYIYKHYSYICLQIFSIFELIK